MEATLSLGQMTSMWTLFEWALQLALVPMERRAHSLTIPFQVPLHTRLDSHRSSVKVVTIAPPTTSEGSIPSDPKTAPSHRKAAFPGLTQ